MLAEILDHAGRLSARSAKDRERIRPGTIYVAPPDRHLLIEPNLVRVTRGPKENRFRPAIDPLFRSAAQTYGPRVIGVILTGYLDDGAAGLWTVKQLGGTTIVQDPSDALIPFMPQNALAHVKVDYCLPLAEIAPLLVRLTSDTEEGVYPVPKEVEKTTSQPDEASRAQRTRIAVRPCDRAPFVVIRNWSERVKQLRSIDV